MQSGELTLENLESRTGEFVEALMEKEDTDFYNEDSAVTALDILNEWEKHDNCGQLNKNDIEDLKVFLRRYINNSKQIVMEPVWLKNRNTRYFKKSRMLS